MGPIKISLAAARVNANFTQAEVAKELKVGKQTISSWENGRSEPGVSQALALSELFEIPIDYIFLSQNLAISEKRKIKRFDISEPAGVVTE